MSFTYITVDGELVGQTAVSSPTGEVTVDPSPFYDAERVVVERETGTADDGTDARATVRCTACGWTFADDDSAAESECPDVDADDDEGPHVLEAIPLAWLNSARVVLDEDNDTVSVHISAGDPNGAFAMDIRRTPDGTMILTVPHAGTIAPHMFMREIHTGAFEISATPFPLDMKSVGRK